MNIANWNKSDVDAAATYVLGARVGSLCMRGELNKGFLAVIVSKLVRCFRLFSFNFAPRPLKIEHINTTGRHIMGLDFTKKKKKWIEMQKRLIYRLDC